MIYAIHIYHIHPISVKPESFILEKSIIHNQTNSPTKYCPDNSIEYSGWLYYEPIFSRSCKEPCFFDQCFNHPIRHGI